MKRNLKVWNKGKSIFLILAILITTLFSTTTTVKAEELGVDGSTGYSYRGISPNINGEYFHNPIYKLEMNGKKVFCIESGIYTTKGTTYYSEPYISSKKDLLSKIAYYGYTNTSQTNYDYAVTQVMIWGDYKFTKLIRYVPIG